MGTSTVLVTGATGNAGGAVVRALLEAGAEVRALVRPERCGELAERRRAGHRRSQQSRRRSNERSRAPAPSSC